jgi:predicted helicase
LKFSELLEKYRQEALSQHEKGYRFEKLMANFLKTYPLYEHKFSHVWLWRDFPHRLSLSPGGGDIGVDLVAKTEDGEWWAVQAKCHQADATISKNSLDSFLGASGKEFKTEDGESVAFDYRLWISTTNNWTATAENEIRGQSVPFIRLGLVDLEAAPVDWEELEAGRFGDKARLPGKAPRPHQLDAIAAAREHYVAKGEARGLATLACGTGKTFLSLKIAEDLSEGTGLILFLAPSIALVGQTLREWSADSLRPFYAICVCSDSEVHRARRGGEDDDSTGVEDLGHPATTRSEVIVNHLRRAERLHPDRLHVIFSTYQSVKRVAEALGDMGRTADLVICD